MADELETTLAHELFDALNSDNLTRAEKLLLKGADPNCVLPVEGVAPMHIASGLGPSATKLLLQYGGEPNIKSVDGTTPLHVASTWGDKECLQMLLVCGGDPFVRDQDGCTVLDCAKSYDHKQCIKLLEYFTLLLNPDVDSTTTPEIIYKCRGEMDNSYMECTSATRKKHRQSLNQSFRYLEEYLDWAYSQDTVTDYTKEITRQLRKYMAHHVGNQFSLDVTSPDHPYLEHRSHIEESAGSSVETNDMAFRQDSLHVHWADELSKTLPWNLDDQDKFNSTCSSVDTFLTCQSEPDDNNIDSQFNFNCYEQNHLDKENDSVLANTPKNFQMLKPSQVSNNFSNNQKVNFKDNVNCQNCDKLRKRSPEKLNTIGGLSASGGYGQDKPQGDITSNLPGSLDMSSKKPKVRCQREIQKWLNSAQPEKLSDGMKRLSLQENGYTDLWQPPSDFQDLDLTDLISSDGSFCQRYERQMLGNKKEKPKICKRSSLSSPAFDRLRPQLKKEIITNSSSKSQNYAKINNPSSPSNQEENVTLTESFDNFSTIDLDETLPYDFETCIKESKCSINRNSTESAGSDVLNRSFCNNSRISLGSVCSEASSVEYIYSDLDKGIRLIEKRIPSQCGSECSRRSSLESALSTGTVDSQKTELYDWKTHCKYRKESNPTESSDVDKSEPLSEEIPQLLKRLSNQEIRERLKSFGDDPGPVTKTTRQTYLVRLVKIEKDPDHVKLQLTNQPPGYPPEIKAALEGNFDASGLGEMEMKMIAAFQNPAKNRCWREGTLKSSFNYLLLDPRVTKNLPQRSCAISELETFQIFIAAIFYIGKGKRARPYCHLYEAINQLKNPKPNVSDKVQHILDIWKDGQGVVSLHCFQSVIPVEAYTREACMVDCLSLNKITNKKRGDYYGIATTWSLKDKRKLGVFLLKKSLQIFLGDGERQISPADIKVGQ